MKRPGIETLWQTVSSWMVSGRNGRKCHLRKWTEMMKTEQRLGSAILISDYKETDGRLEGMRTGQQIDTLLCCQAVYRISLTSHTQTEDTCAAITPQLFTSKQMAPVPQLTTIVYKQTNGACASINDNCLHVNK